MISKVVLISDGILIMGSTSVHPFYKSAVKIRHGSSLKRVGSSFNIMETFGTLKTRLDPFNVPIEPVCIFDMYVLCLFRYLGRNYT